MTEVKKTIQQLTDGHYYSLHDASVALGQSKRNIMQLVRGSGFEVIMVFGKYTVLSWCQIKLLREHFDVQGGSYGA